MRKVLAIAALVAATFGIAACTPVGIGQVAPTSGNARVASLEAPTTTTLPKDGVSNAGVPCNTLEPVYVWMTVDPADLDPDEGPYDPYVVTSSECNFLNVGVDPSRFLYEDPRG